MTDIKYLTESTLGTMLTKVFPSNTFVYNKSVPNSTNKRFRPDYRCDELRLIVEFDGYSHYCTSKQIVNDSLKDKDYQRLGFDVVRIPYFIQISSVVLFNLFGVYVDTQQTYPHGFVDKKAILPSDFCQLGINKFVDDLERFDYIQIDVLDSLRSKILELDDINLVLPPSLYHLVFD